MTCSACVRAVTETLEAKPYLRKANVVLLTSSAIVDFEGHDHAEQFTETTSELGYGVVLEEVKLFSQRQAGKDRMEAEIWEAEIWKASFTVNGMTDSSCALVITEALEHESWIKNADTILRMIGLRLSLRTRETSRKYESLSSRS